MFKREDLLWAIPLLISFAVALALIEPHCFNRISKYVQDAGGMRCQK